ncbi:MAG: hypothetical protein K0S23_2717 [Fluviicola sp.]|jgi:hypothetical protein|uniref:hypothetical protein n=1 Tax=Fluviicola sp. TaxID=1917219 RepID=UPI002626C2AA|nr:hypothetical protein [Fluviicola sp.]MDF3028410.1 hypothetical protein [Fluviicola sp.]
MKPNRVSWFLPVENYIIHTKLSEEEIIQRLTELTKNTGSKSNASLFGLGTLFGQKSGGPYEGKIQSKEFKISRIISYRNSFLPVIKGSISSFLNQREITISMGLNLVVKIFTIVWFSIVAISAFFILDKFLHTNENPFLTNLFPLQMAVFGYVVMILSFKFESRKSKKDLKKLFEAEVV